MNERIKIVPVTEFGKTGLSNRSTIVVPERHITYRDKILKSGMLIPNKPVVKGHISEEHRRYGGIKPMVTDLIPEDHIGNDGIKKKLIGFTSDQIEEIENVESAIDLKIKLRRGLKSIKKQLVLHSAKIPTL